MKIIYFIVACIATALGILGVVLPILPTTPFLLLAAFCFAKSSKRCHNWFVSSKLYQNHLETFVQNRSMTLRTKISLLSLASSMLLIAMYFMNSIWLRVFIMFLIFVKFYYFIFRIKTIRTREER